MRRLGFGLWLCVWSFQALAYTSQSGYTLPDPPAPRSAELRHDYAVVYQYQSTRTRAECVAADAQSYPSVETFFGPSTGVLSAEETRVAAVKLKSVLSQVFDVTDEFKERFHRLRPFADDSRVKPCVKKPNPRTSYPSAHAAGGVVLAELLAKMYPKKRELILEQGLRVGENRVLGGVHFPSDVEAGRELARQILNSL